LFEGVTEAYEQSSGEDERKNEKKKKENESETEEFGERSDRGLGFVRARREAVGYPVG